MSIKTKIEHFLATLPNRFINVFTSNKFVLSFFFLVALIIATIFIDTFILPKNTINDTVVEVKELLEYSRDSDKYKRIGHVCKTENDYIFYINNLDNIDLFSNQNYKIELTHTLLLKNTIGVKSNTIDYSDQLFSSTLNEVMYFYLVILTFLIITIIILYFNIFIKRNSLWNLIGFTIFLIVIWLFIENMLKFQTPLFRF